VELSQRAGSGKLQLRTDEGVRNGIDAVMELVPNEIVASGAEAPSAADAYLCEQRGDAGGGRRGIAKPYRAGAAGRSKHRLAATIGLMAAAAPEAEWDRRVASLRSRDRVPAALANADLLSDARPDWCDRLVARTSMHDLLFTRPGDEYPFSATVRVSADGDIYQFELRRKGVLVTADRATRQNALAVLSAFLMQLDTGSAPKDCPPALGYERKRRDDERHTHR